MPSLIPLSSVPAEARLDVLTASLAPVFEQIEWAEDEVQLAMKRHPWAADTLWHSFSILKATRVLLRWELPYRAHCRELLDRVAAGLDTRPGTSAEILSVASDISKINPMNATGFGTYMRALRQALLEVYAAVKPTLAIDRHSLHEALHSERIDSLEGEVRHRLTVHDRSLDTITCAGRHHGEPALCRYATAPDHIDAGGPSLADPFRPVLASATDGRVHHVYRFANGFGASIVRATERSGVELAVVTWESTASADDDYHVTDQTPITNDVVARLTPEELTDLLVRIHALPRSLPGPAPAELAG
ncbi:hypothetical protein [Nonomuraea dietziae]|uniref:Uncharacterized protein n=1 Tax=Nonomuraea dietziae TaxID=65515 RepID=A0A7W5YE40_9ACTN|nr:hypothetical protein [Nonomuraea dietziae]MBB3734076.1 hypothetical protein [Nonomuraea dietziae]